jgi:hypothetical protein
VLFAAEATYVSFGASWQTVKAPEIKFTAPVEGLTVTDLPALVVPQRPLAVAVIVAAPKKAGSQSMTPVAGSIVPAVTGRTEYVIDVLLSAVAVYISSGASWHIAVAPAINVMGPVSGLTVTSLSVEVTPHNPVAVAVMVAVPKKAASQFITPVAMLIEPAVAGRTEYTKPVLLRAVAIYVSFGASWQTVVAPARNVGVAVEGLTVTALEADVLPHSPVAVAVIVAVPKNAASQSITPVAGSIDPAAAGRTEYVITVLLRAVAVYVVFGSSWHTVKGPAEKAVGPVDGLTVTSLVALDVPHGPVAVAVIVDSPENAAFQFITPVEALIAPAVTGSTEYVIAVLPAAVAAYVSSGASWHSIMAPDVNDVGPTAGLTVTMRSAVVVPHSPVAVAVIVAGPENAASQSMVPVTGSIVPAVAGATEYEIAVLLRAVAV